MKEAKINRTQVLYSQLKEKFGQDYLRDKFASSNNNEQAIS